MPKVIINGKAYPAEVGETLLEVARRNGAHVGFICDGQGICTTCECKVLEGKSSLSKPEAREKARILNRLRKNYRLACQTRLVDEGEVQVISRVEILRRQFIYSFLPPPGQSRLKNSWQIVSNIAEITTDTLKQTPTGIPSVLKQVPSLRSELSLRNMKNYLGDTVKVINHTNSGAKLAALPEPKATTVKNLVEAVKPAELPAPVKVASAPAPVQVAPTPPPAPVVKVEAPAPVQAAPTPPPAPVVKVEAPAPVQAVPTPPPPVKVVETPTTAPRFERNNLQKIEGIGPRISSVLNKSGIYTYKQLAETPVIVLQEILLAEGLKLNDPTSFPTQAKLALEEKWEELQALQDRLKGGR
jgi:ferredoxin